MRIMKAPLAALALMAAISPARAQTYDPAYPICLQTFGISGNAISCRYTSMNQCQFSARSRAAQCIVNPYYGGAPRKGRTWR
ncbi:MAG: DUF3551 domain-containing protein [Bradyrhizobium sp.]|nr:DUF3551 domain-containing protein [Bradyrhizobium sp.]